MSSTMSPHTASERIQTTQADTNPNPNTNPNTEYEHLHSPLCHRATVSSCALATGAAPTGLFYSLRNKNLRPTKVFYHHFGDECKGSAEFEPNDRLLFQSKNEMFRVGVSRTPDRRYIMVGHGSNTENESYVISITDDQMEPTCLKPMESDVEYRCTKSGPFWFMRTKEGCVSDHFRVLRCVQPSEAELAPFEWEPYIAEKSRYPLQEHRHKRNPNMSSRRCFLVVMNRVRLCVALTCHATPGYRRHERLPWAAVPGLRDGATLTHRATDRC
jgi:protease II